MERAVKEVACLGFESDEQSKNKVDAAFEKFDCWSFHLRVLLIFGFTRALKKNFPAVTEI